MTKPFHHSALRRVGVSVFLGVLASASALAQKTSDGNRMRVACYVDPSSEGGLDAIQSSLSDWAKSIAPTRFHSITADVMADRGNLAESLKAGSHDLYGLFAYQFLEMGDQGMLRPALATSGKIGITSTFVLVTRKADAITSFEHLRDKTILVDTGGVGQLPVKWLAIQIAIATSPDQVFGFSNIVLVQNPNRALLPVFFGLAFG
jgi:hypothetical protein